MTDPLAAQLAEVLAQAVPGTARLGLRERKKAAAIRRIQEVAVAQFEEHGFDAVTIEQIAEHAEVSPSSIYRYFGTKEGLILHDEYDDLVLDVAPRLFARTDPWTALTTAIRLMQGTHFVADQLVMRRMRIWSSTPSVRAAGFVTLDETAKALAPMMHAADRHGRSLADYEVVAAALMAGVFCALERWYDDGGGRDIADYVFEAVEVLRPAWAPAPPGLPRPAARSQPLPGEG
ncbi:MAG: TetR/AcrR family transcriptional regulator [Actinobacteria bacterium]|nr:TetR/AcrR family transcriptional regulator [Actinomycetota bacterium]